MSEPTPDQSLHLPSLVIKNFRGIDELTIPRLGRVTLLAGKNGVGKTTVLDAVRIYAAGGSTAIDIGSAARPGRLITCNNRTEQGQDHFDWPAFFGRRIQHWPPIPVS